MRILLVNSPLVPVPPTYGGAIEMHTYKLANEFASLGNEVDYITSTTENAKFMKNITVREVGFSGSFHSGWLMTYRDALYASSLAIRKVITAIREEDYDIIHHHDRLTAWVHGLLGFQSRNTVYTMHNPSPYTYDCSSDFRQAIRKLSFDHMEKSILLKAKMVISVSKELRNEAVQRLLIDQAKVRVIPNGVDVEQFQPGLQSSKISSKFSLPERYALFVGKMESRKGLHYLFDALRKKPIDLVVVGGGPDFEQLVGLAARFGLSKKVHFLGPVDFEDLRQIYSGASFLIIPSIAEGLPLVMLEGMSSGLPVVASKLSGMEQVVEEGINGILINPGDVEGLAQATSQLWADESMTQKMGISARKKVVSKFSWRSVALQLQDVYERMI
jgi:glycosyltransferase involved in cell wall biosynthesis